MRRLGIQNAMHVMDMGIWLGTVLGIRRRLGHLAMEKGRTKREKEKEKEKEKGRAKERGKEEKVQHAGIVASLVIRRIHAGPQRRQTV